MHYVPRVLKKKSRLVVLFDFTHAFQGYFTDIAAITQTYLSMNEMHNVSTATVNKPCKIWENMNGDRSTTKLCVYFRQNTKQITSHVPMNNTSYSHDRIKRLNTKPDHISTYNLTLRHKCHFLPFHRTLSPYMSFRSTLMNLHISLMRCGNRECFLKDNLQDTYMYAE